MSTDFARCKLAAITYARGQDIDRLLVDVVARLSTNGLRLGGLLQISTGAKGAAAATVHVVDLKSGERFDIWEDRGPSARACRLREDGLFAATAAIDAAIAARVDLLVLNRFGRAESKGRGLIDSFVAAVDAGIPVLTSVRAPHEIAWRQFHGGHGLELAPRLDEVVSWFGAVTGVVAPGQPMPA